MGLTFVMLALLVGCYETDEYIASVREKLAGC
jgi:hypothetical protein